MRSPVATVRGCTRGWDGSAWEISRITRCGRGAASSARPTTIATWVALLSRRVELPAFEECDHLRSDLCRQAHADVRHGQFAVIGCPCEPRLGHRDGAVIRAAEARDQL